MRAEISLATEDEIPAAEPFPMPSDPVYPQDDAPVSDSHEHEWIKLPNGKDRCLRCREIRDMGNVVKCQASACPKNALTLHEDGAGKWLWLCDEHGDMLAVGFPLKRGTDDE